MYGNKRRRTIWADPASDSASQTTDFSIPSVRLGQVTGAAQDPFRQGYDQSPWEHYEAGAEAFCGRDVTLARHRGHRKGVVHVQCLKKDRSSAQSRVKTIDQCKHSSFPRLLDVYNAGEHHFLVWEPVEFSVQHLLNIDLRLSDSDIAQVIRPVLEGIQFLQDQGLVLAALSPNTVLLTGDGNVKIGVLPDTHAVGWWTDPSHSVGVEESCRIPNEDMHADTLKLTALAVIIKQLMDRVAATMEKWKEPHSWGPGINSFLQDLRKKPLDELLKDPFLASRAVGGLRWLATAANKEVRLEIRRLNADGIQYDSL